MARQQLLVEDFRVQSLERCGGWRSFTIVGPDGRLLEEADRFLLGFDGSGTQRTYAHYLVDHLRWRAREGLALAAVTLRDLERYMGAVGAKVNGPFGEPWRIGKRRYGPSALATAAACLKGFYLHHAARGVNRELGAALGRSRLPTRADRRRRLLGHTT
ncbi:MAG: tyrosine-type recombinase/integrase, partial [Thermocrispum sp.]